MAEIFTAQGDRATMGWARESTFKTLATPSIWHCFTNFGIESQNTMPKLTGARGSIAEPYPATGGRVYSGGVDIESDGDTIGQALAFTLGNQSTPSATILNATTNGAKGTGANSFTLRPWTDTAGNVIPAGVNVFPGMNLAFDTAGNLETLTVASVSGSVIKTTTNSAFAHADNCAVVCHSSGLTHVSVMKMGTPLPTFSQEINIFGASAGSSLECYDFTGCKVDAMAIQLTPGGVLIPKFTVCAAHKQVNSTPTTATISTKQPIVFEQQFSNPQCFGKVLTSGAEATLESASITLSNNIVKNRYGLGAGNEVVSFPEGPRSVSGSIVVGYENTDTQTAFEAAATGGALPSTSLLIPLYTTDLVVPNGNTGAPYAVTLYLPSVALTKLSPGIVSTGPLKQTFTFMAAESAAGAQDTLTVFYIGNSASAF